MAPGDLLTVGRQLVVHGGKKNLAISSRETSPVSTAMRNQRIVYRVRKGDSLYGIAEKFRVSVRQIVAWNRIKETGLLRPGQKLLLHVDVTRQS